MHSISNSTKSTIHGVKGETHEATMLISMYTEWNWYTLVYWIGDKTSEAARFAYVEHHLDQSKYSVWCVS